MLEKYRKELAAIYDHLITKKENADISTLSKELTIDEETLAGDIKYLRDRGYIEANILFGQKTGTIADVRITGITAEGRDVIEEKQK